MEEHEPTHLLRSTLPPEPLVGISIVAENMSDVRRHLRPAGFEQFESFGFSYHAVTTTIEDQVAAQRMFGMQYFKQPQVLDTAIGIFHHKWTAPFELKLADKPGRPHWNVLMEDERVLSVDRGTQAALGYIAHIGGDLASTVYETATSGRYNDKVMRDYVRHDYFKIDKSLALAAQKIAPKLIDIENPRARNAVVKLAMGGIVLGRKYALKDYRKLVRAGSEDERQTILENSEQRTARLGLFVLGSSYQIQNVLRKDQRTPDLSAFDAAA